MAILIEDMEMPTSCDKCIYSAWSNFYQIYVCNAVRKNEPVLFDGKQTKSTAVARSARADNCPLRPAPEWISVEERLPEDEGYVLAWRPGERVGFFYADPRAVAYYIEQTNVTHWMPLPEQPKED